MIEKIEEEYREMPAVCRKGIMTLEQYELQRIVATKKQIESLLIFRHRLHKKRLKNACV
jgi:hypothetical protein